MQFKIQIPLITLLLLIVGCQKDDVFLKEDNNVMSRERSSSDINISYEKSSYTLIEPLNIELEDMCEGDLSMITQVTKLWIVNAFINKSNPCLSMEKYAHSVLPKKSNQKSRQMYGKDYSLESKTEICDGKMYFSNTDTTFQVAFTSSEEFWQEVVINYNLSDEQAATQFIELVSDAKSFGNVVSQTESTITILEIDENGDQVETTYSTLTYLPVTIVTTTKDGEKIIETYSYKCSSDGRVVPESIVTITKEISPVCNEPYTKTIIQQFNNYQINR